MSSSMGSRPMTPRRVLLAKKNRVLGGRQGAVGNQDDDSAPGSGAVYVFHYSHCSSVPA